jgi:small-conductance mechanosensitive channel
VAIGFSYGKVDHDHVALVVALWVLPTVGRVPGGWSSTRSSSQAGWAQRTLGLDQRVLDQIAVVCSGLFRVVAFVVAAVAALAPFGTDPSDLVVQLGRGAAGRLPIGDINIAPIKVAGAALVLMFGIAAIRALQRWLLDSFLPTTKLDPGMRTSVTSLLGAAGVVVVAAFA